MKTIASFLKLIRWQNLVFIVLTQLLFYYCIYYPRFHDANHDTVLALLIVASVAIAAAGYIINDYFDLDIDVVNKPGKIVLDRDISRRWAILLHLLFSFLGIVATALALSFHKWYLVFANVGCIMLLWLYSTSFKRQAIIGNVIISVLTAWTILVIFFALLPVNAAFGGKDERIVSFFRISFLYAAFAFIISLIREAVKDVEDIDGDRRGGCKTLPIVAGITATKIYTTVWIVVLTAALCLLQLYILQFRWWWAVVYSILFVIIPMIYLFFQHRKAKTTADFASLSRLTKWIMLAGIVSMVFFRIYS
jgi:4-hydroxybenzoate polyprenyltransferase